MTATTAKSESRERMEEFLRRILGKDILGHLNDPAIVEILLNPDGQVWVDVLGGGLEPRGRLDAGSGRMIIDTVASMLGTAISAESPIISGELPIDGSRFEGLIPPVVERPTFTIRKKALLIFTLEDYVAKGIMTARQREVLINAVRNRWNILVSGGTGTGKTTLANAILHAVSQETPEHRIVIIEDTRELQCAAPDTVFLRTSDTIDMTRLLKSTMRMRPDRIVVGEVRGPEALALLKAWNTGHPGGVGTVHANDARAALIRVGQLIQEANVPPAPHLIAEAVNLVVSIKRTPNAHGADRGRDRAGPRVPRWRIRHVIGLTLVASAERPQYRFCYLGSVKLSTLWQHTQAIAEERKITWSYKNWRYFHGSECLGKNDVGESGRMARSGVSLLVCLADISDEHPQRRVGIIDVAWHCNAGVARGCIVRDAPGYDLRTRLSRHWPWGGLERANRCIPYVPIFHRVAAPMDEPARMDSPNTCHRPGFGAGYILHSDWHGS